MKAPRFQKPDLSGWRDVRQAASLPVITIGLTASMGGFLFGADTGQISGFLVMRDYLRRFAQNDPSAPNGHKFSDAREGLLVGLLSIGALCGALIGAPIADKFGRKWTMIFFCGIFYIGNTVQITTQHAWYQMMIGRYIAGLAVGSLSGLVPVYVSETVPKQVRGTLVACYQLFVTMGILTSYLINFGTSKVQQTSWSWRGPIAIVYLWAGVLGLGMACLPESPRWLLSKGRKEDCQKALRWIAGKKNRDNHALIESQYQEMVIGLQKESVGKGASFFSSFNPKDKILYRTILGFTLQMFQQLTGANYFFYYGASIFQSVGISDSFVTQIILGAVNVVTTFPGLWFIERFGRRRPLIYGGLWQFTWLLVFAIVGSQGNPQSSTIGYVLIIAACMFIAGFASTWGPGVWVAIGEIFPLRVRSKSASIATAGNWIWNFLLTFFTPFITSAIGYRYGYVFAGCNLMGVLIVYFFYYESSNLTLEHVDEMYLSKDTKPWTSQSFSSRKEAAEAQKEQEAINTGMVDGTQHYENANLREARSESQGSYEDKDKEEV